MPEISPVCPVCGGVECVGSDFCGVTGKRITPLPAPAVWKRRPLQVAVLALVALFCLWYFGNDIRYRLYTLYENNFGEPKFPKSYSNLMGFDTMPLNGVPVTAYYLPDNGFQTLKLHAKTGRLLQAEDATSDPPGVVMREEVAYLLIRAAKDGLGRTIQSQDFVGKEVRVGDLRGQTLKTYVIVGVAGKGSLGPAGFQGELNEETAVLYLPGGLLNAGAAK